MKECETIFDELVEGEPRYDEERIARLENPIGRDAEPIENAQEVTRTLILMKMGKHALAAREMANKFVSTKDKTAEQRLAALELFRVPFAVQCTKSYLALLVGMLCQELAELRERDSPLAQSRVLNLIFILLANLECISAC